MMILDIDTNIVLDWDNEKMETVDDELDIALQEIHELKEDVVGWLLTQRNRRHDAINNLLDICHGRLTS